MEAYEAQSAKNLAGEGTYLLYSSNTTPGVVLYFLPLPISSHHHQPRETCCHKGQKCWNEMGINWSLK